MIWGGGWDVFWDNVWTVGWGYYFFTARFLTLLLSLSSTVCSLLVDTTGANTLFLSLSSTVIVLVLDTPELTEYSFSFPLTLSLSLSF